MLLFAVVFMAASAPAAAVPVAPNTLSSTTCPQITSYYAWQRDKPLAPRKLTELPPAVGYMAVYRTINGCNTPLTVVEYRRARR